MTSRILIAFVTLAACGFAGAENPNLALDGTARSWLENSVASVPTALVNDGDALSFWGSNAPSTDPPKDIGIEWDAPRRIGYLRLKFYSAGYVPADDGWRIEALLDGEWQRLPASASGTESAWWEFRFRPIETTAIRLVTTGYRDNRVAVAEFEAYESRPTLTLRRAPLLDGAFWAFHYQNWAEKFTDDSALADEVNRAHEIGLDIIILYTLTGRDGFYSTTVPDTVLPQSDWWAGRDPLEAILTRADELGMRVYLGDAWPTGYDRPVDAAKEAAATKLLDEYRRQMLEGYAGHESLVGYYINYECCPDNFGNSPEAPARHAQRVAKLVKSVAPKLHVVQPVGLYSWRDEKDDPWGKVTPEKLETFWGPFIADTPDIDAYMVIDGVGTGLAPLNYADANQAKIRELCDRHGKQMWTDVEVAIMGRKYEAMPIGWVVNSLRVAAQHAETIVGFCYFNYMSPNTGREPSARLYRDYGTYRLGVLTGADTEEIR